jgi:hypothetical protein
MNGEHVPPIDWQGNEIQVAARLVPHFLWSTASIDVFVSGSCVLRTGGQPKVTGACSSEFSHNGVVHRAELTWGRGVLRSFPYRLEIDSVLVSESRVRVENWPLSLLAPGSLLFLGLAVLIMINYALRTYHLIR